MITRESLQEKYIKLETIDLLEIFANKQDHTELAVSVAHAELRKRQIPEDEINSYQSVFTHENEPIVLKNYLVDLKIWQKLVFYFIWIPRLRIYFNYNFSPGGYILKSNQSNYYSITGFIFFIVAMIISTNYGCPFYIIWIAGLLVSYIFDMLYNKQRQIDGLQKKVNEGKILEW